MSPRGDRVKKKVLLVDDVKLFIEMEKTFLNREDIDIYTASSGEEALRLHKKEKMDLILLDLYMPKMKGNEVCSIIRNDENLKDVSIIMVTTSLKEEDIRLCREAGANDVINKPIDPKLLLSKVSKLLGIPERKNLRILVRLKIEGVDGGVQFFGNTIDISMTGILIETDKELSIGEEVNISLVLPGRTALLQIKGKVMRRVDLHRKGGYGYGVRFLNLNPEQKTILRDFIEHKR